MASPKRKRLYGPGEAVPVLLPAEVVGRLYRIGSEYGLTVVDTIEMLAGGRSLKSKPSNSTKKAKKTNV